MYRKVGFGVFFLNYFTKLLNYFADLNILVNLFEWEMRFLLYILYNFLCKWNTFIITYTWSILLYYRFEFYITFVNKYKLLWENIKRQIVDSS